MYAGVADSSFSPILETFACALNNNEDTFCRILRLMLLLPVDNMTDALSWDVTLLSGICQAMKYDLEAALAVE
jgi:hypothetical protein